MSDSPASLNWVTASLAITGLLSLWTALEDYRADHEIGSAEMLAAALTVMDVPADQLFDPLHYDPLFGDQRETVFWWKTARTHRSMDATKPLPACTEDQLESFGLHVPPSTETPLEIRVEVAVWGQDRWFPFQISNTDRTLLNSPAGPDCAVVGSRTVLPHLDTWPEGLRPALERWPQYRRYRMDGSHMDESPMWASAQLLHVELASIGQELGVSTDDWTTIYGAVRGVLQRRRIELPLLGLDVPISIARLWLAVIAVALASLLSRSLRLASPEDFPWSSSPVDSRWSWLVVSVERTCTLVLYGFALIAPVVCAVLVVGGENRRDNPFWVILIGSLLLSVAIVFLISSLQRINRLFGRSFPNS